MIEAVLGRVAGRAAGILFLLFHLHIGGATIRDYSEFISGNFFQRTPILVITASMLLVCAMVVKSGVETIARCAQIFMPAVLALLLINVVLLIPDMDITEMLPILGNGPLPVVKGIFVVQGWFCQFVLITFLLPYVEGDKANRAGYWSVAAAAATMVLINLTVLFLFGIDASQFYYPFLMASRYIRVADFIEHVEAMVMASWVLGTFVRISLFLLRCDRGSGILHRGQSRKAVRLSCGIAADRVRILGRPQHAGAAELYLDLGKYVYHDGIYCLSCVSRLDRDRSQRDGKIIALLLCAYLI
ncbi:GerAB/ArcD/ProY family transporter [Cohnella rhizosphaerae]|uniref:Endospore germination permease n=1 Tax=Cohnella rhizosphaerae TaxID=1457232 RepID=A0A9X4L504_9BACL|nr:endospore germination permease [Cohnella rhizosphaerae]MDG0813592.1 endospore germination permease [Cohnella rhizosphaerae]